MFNSGIDQNRCRDGSRSGAIGVVIPCTRVGRRKSMLWMGIIGHYLRDEGGASLGSVVVGKWIALRAWHPLSCLGRYVLRDG